MASNGHQCNVMATIVTNALQWSPFMLRIIVHLQLPHFLLKADSDTNGDLCTNIFILQTFQSYIPASSSLSPEGPSTGPEGQQRCQRWPLHRKNGRKSSYSAPADPSPAPASLSLCPEGPSPAGVQVVKWLLDCLTFSSTPLCLFVTHPPIFLDFGKFVFVFLSSSQHISCYFCFRISDSITLSIQLGTWHLWRADSISFAQNIKIPLMLLPCVGHNQQTSKKAILSCICLPVTPFY